VTTTGAGQSKVTRHAAAQRHLFNRLIGQLYFCLQHSQPFDKTKAVPAADQRYGRMRLREETAADAAPVRQRPETSDNRPVDIELSIAVAQPHIAMGAVSANVGAHATMIDQAHARLVVFQELSSTGYRLDAPPVDLPSDVMNRWYQPALQRVPPPWSAHPWYSAGATTSRPCWLTPLAPAWPTAKRISATSSGCVQLRSWKALTMLVLTGPSGNVGQELSDVRRSFCLRDSGEHRWR
jgi:hypothetical protein